MSQTYRLVTVIALIALLACDAGALPLPIANPGAEKPAEDNPGRPAGVDVWQTGHINAVFGRDTNIKRSGDASFYIHNKGSQPPGDPGTAVFMITGPVDAGLNYTATGWVKTRAAAETNLRLRLRSADGQWINCNPKFQTLDGTHDWTKVACTWPGVAGAAEFILFLRVRGTGEAWFDDIEIHDDFDAGQRIVEFKLLISQASEAIEPIKRRPRTLGAVIAADALAQFQQVVREASQYQQQLDGVLASGSVPVDFRSRRAALTGRLRKALTLAQRINAIDDALANVDRPDAAYVAGWASPAAHVFLRDCPV